MNDYDSKRDEAFDADHEEWLTHDRDTCDCGRCENWRAAEASHEDRDAHEAAVTAAVPTNDNDDEHTEAWLEHDRDSCACLACTSWRAAVSTDGDIVIAGVAFPPALGAELLHRFSDIGRWVAQDMSKLRGGLQPSALYAGGGSWIDSSETAWAAYTAVLTSALVTERFAAQQ
jgi:hypothetical protein